MVEKKIEMFNLLPLSLAAGCLLMFANLAYAVNLKEYYPIQLGNRWIYQTSISEEGATRASQETISVSGKEKISEVETIRMISSESDNISECIAFDEEGVKKFKEYNEDNFRVFNPPVIIFPSSLKVGESREYPANSMTVRHKSNDVSSVVSSGLYTGTVKITLGLPESVVVPAGTFDNCLKFFLVYNYKGTKRYGENKYSIWLAPGVGVVKKICEGKKYDPDVKKTIEFNESSELVSASIGKISNRR